MADLRAQGGRESPCPQGTTEVRCSGRRILDQGINRLLDYHRAACKAFKLAGTCNPIKQHRGGKHQGGGIGSILTGEVWRRSMLGLRHAVRVAGVDGCAETETPREFRGFIGEDVTEHV